MEGRSRKGGPDFLNPRMGAAGFPQGVRAKVAPPAAYPSEPVEEATEVC